MIHSEIIFFLMNCKAQFKDFVFVFACDCLIALVPFRCKGCLSSVEMLLDLCQKSIDCICVDLFLDSRFCSFDLYVCPAPCWPDYCSCVVGLNLG